MDLKPLNMRTELEPIAENGRTKLPAASFTLSKEEKIRFCKTLSEIKAPDGYSSNIRNRVSMQDLKLYGMKSHDCHVLTLSPMIAMFSCNNLYTSPLGVSYQSMLKVLSSGCVSSLIPCAHL